MDQLSNNRRIYALLVTITILVVLSFPIGPIGLVSPSAAQGEPPITGLAIHVVDSYGNPIAGASVSSIMQPQGQPPLTDKANSTGHVRFGDIAAGSYTFEVIAEGYYYEYPSTTAIAGEISYKTVCLSLFTCNGPHASELLYKLYSNGEAEYLGLLSGEIDIMADSIPTAWMSNATGEVGQGHLNVSTRSAEAISYVLVNCLPEKYPLNVTGFRKALAYMIDKPELAQDIQEADPSAYCSTVSGNVLPESFGVWLNKNVTKYAGSLVLANKTLWESGFYYDGNHGNFPFTDGFWRDKSGNILRPIEIFNASPPPALYWRTWFLAEELSEAMTQLGLNYTVKQYPGNWVIMNAPWDDWDISLLNWGYAPDPAYLYSQFNTNGGYNWVFWNNATFDYWSNIMMTSASYDEVLGACYKCQKLIADGLPWIPLFEWYIAEAVRTDWKGWVDSAAEYYGWFNFYSLLEAHPSDRNYGGRLRIGTRGVGLVNPFESMTYLPGLISIYDTLVRLDPYTLQVRPWMAESYSVEIFNWTSTERGSKITLRLRNDLMWHDGIKANASDAKFTLEWREYEPFDRLPFVIHNVTIVDENTAIVYANTTYMNAIAWLAFRPILPEHIWRQYRSMSMSDLQAMHPYESRLLVGSGPYIFVEYKEGEYLRLKANPNYFSTRPQMSTAIPTSNGTSVKISDPVSGIEVTFDNVTSSGITAVATSESGPGAPWEFNVAGQYYHITSTSTYSENIVIGIPYNEAEIQGNEENLKLMHWNQSTANWDDITTWVNTTANIIYGNVSGLSVFAIMESMSFNIGSYITDSNFNGITYFDLVFTKLNTGDHKLTSTCPGEFYYNIKVENNLPVDTLTIDVSIPEDFVLKGASPIHVYLGTTDITAQCTITETPALSITVRDVPATSLIYATIHLDYGLKGTTYTSLDAWWIRGYVFHVSASGYGGVGGTYSSSADLIAHQKKTTAIAGYVTDANGKPLTGVTVELIDSIGPRYTVTDENGFYNFIGYSAGDYKVIAYYKGVPHTTSVSVQDKQLAQVDIKIP